MMKKESRVEYYKRNLPKETKLLISDKQEESLGAFEKWILEKTNAQANFQRMVNG